MPKGSPELIEKRKNEILDACEIVYKEQGFQGVNIKEISTATSMTRSTIYNYYQTKEEILLGLLVREYEQWTSELASICANDRMDKKSVANAFAKTLADKVILLRILNMNLMEIEINTRMERLSEFKQQFLKEITILTEILCAYNAHLSKEECEIFCTNFNSFLFGVYPFTHHTEKQNQAMKLVGLEWKEHTIYDMVYEFLLRTLPNA